MKQQNLYFGNDESKQSYRFFLPLYVSADRKALYTPKLKYSEAIYSGARLIIKHHIETSQFGQKSKRYRLYIDESQVDPLPGGYGDSADKRIRQKER